MKTLHDKIKDSTDCILYPKGYSYPEHISINRADNVVIFKQGEYYSISFSGNFSSPDLICLDEDDVINILSHLA